MRSLLSVLALVGVLALARAQDAEAEADEPRALLLVHKDLTLGETRAVVLEQNFTVTYDIYNIGSLAATRVALIDDWPKEDFEVVEGKDRTEWDEIAPGAQVSTKIVLRAKRKGIFTASRAAVEYAYGDLAEDQAYEAQSSTFGKVNVLELREYKKLAGETLAEWIGFWIGAAAISVVPFFLYRKAAAEVVTERSSKKFA